MKSVVVIAHNLRSTHNVGSLLRTTEGLGITKVWLTGYSPYPLATADTRLPHIAQKLDTQIHKTALGAETHMSWEHSETLEPVLQQLKSEGYTIAALEQAPHSIQLPTYTSPDKIALILGGEVKGIEPNVLVLSDICLEIPMFGKKESFNVIQAAAIALYHITHYKN